MDIDRPVSVKDVMSTPLATISAKATVKEASEQMREQNINGLFVPGSSGGIITTTDVVEAVAEGSAPSEVQVGDVMTAPIERITTEEQLTEAAAMMTNFGIKHLPVVDTDGDYVGMISTTDITSEIA